MNWEEHKFLLFVKQNLLILILVVAGLICFGYGLISLMSSRDTNDDLLIGSSELASVDNAKKIKADIEGAVLKPGVYELQIESRIQELIVAGGGLSSDADRDWVAKNINLAQKINDGAKIYIPKQGENTQVSKDSSMTTTSSLININTANTAALDELPGVGPATADKIINNRPYQSLEELVSKKAVSSKIFEDIKDKISLY